MHQRLLFSWEEILIKLKGGMIGYSKFNFIIFFLHKRFKLRDAPESSNRKGENNLREKICSYLSIVRSQEVAGFDISVYYFLVMY